MRAHRSETNEHMAYPLCYRVEYNSDYNWSGVKENR
jgi:hypothetical protein